MKWLRKEHQWQLVADTVIKPAASAVIDDPGFRPAMAARPLALPLGPAWPGERIIRHGLPARIFHFAELVADARPGVRPKSHPLETAESSTTRGGYKLVTDQ